MNTFFYELKNLQSGIGEDDQEVNVNWFNFGKQHGSCKVSDRFTAGTAEGEAARESR